MPWSFALLSSAGSDGRCAAAGCCALFLATAMALLGQVAVDRRPINSIAFIFFFSSRRRHTSSLCDWSSDVCSSDLKARVDSPAWHLVEALATLVSPDGNEPAIDGYADKARPLSASDKAMVATAARRLDEAVAKREMGVDHWVHDVSWVEALERLVSRPTVNIEGLVGGYTGPGGKTILPHRAVAKLDLRRVPDMTA